MQSAVLWVLSARSLGPLPFQQHQTERGLMAVGSLNSKLASYGFPCFQKNFCIYLLDGDRRGVVVEHPSFKPVGSSPTVSAGKYFEKLMWNNQKNGYFETSATRHIRQPPFGSEQQRRNHHWAVNTWLWSKILKSIHTELNKRC